MWAEIKLLILFWLRISVSIVAEEIDLENRAMEPAAEKEEMQSQKTWSVLFGLALHILLRRGTFRKSITQLDGRLMHYL